MAKHEALPLNDGYDFPTEVSDTQMTFPGSLDQLIPKMEKIPDLFKQSHGLHVDFAEAWFFDGWPGKKFTVYPRGDVDPERATRHLFTILRSYQPQHQHKIAAVAWLSSRWFDIKRNDT